MHLHHAQRIARQVLALLLASVTLVVHVPLHLNSGARTPAPLLAAYGRAFRSIGNVTDRPGIGTWLPDGATRLSFEADDHVFITTTVPRARAFLAAFLPRMRRDLDQDATLGEIFGGWYGTGDENRERVEIVLPRACRCTGRIRAIEFALAAAGGSSEYRDGRGTHVYASVALERVNRILVGLRRLHETPRVTRSTFVLTRRSVR